MLTEVQCRPLAVQCTPDDNILLLGSCFADEIGSRMLAAGFSVCINPFGTLYNPVSIAAAVRRLDGESLFCEADCVQMGAGSSRICSFEHHTSFSRESAEEFLRDANEALREAREAWKAATKVIVTLGTARVWEHLGEADVLGDAGRAGVDEMVTVDGVAPGVVSGGCGQEGRIVSNCLKRDGREFRSRMLSVAQCEACLREIVATHPEKDFIFTVSPIRHMGEGAHDNTLSKATLQLAVAGVMRDCAAGEPRAANVPCEIGEACASGVPRAAASMAYFPAYEILCDELRDYRFYARDLVHPSDLAIDIIWDRFLATAVPASYHDRIAASLKQHRQSQHRPLK